MKTTLVKVNHNGSCENYHYTAGVAVELPESVLKALGSDSYEVVGEEPEEKASYKELAAKAKELGLNPTGKKYNELVEAIEEAEKAKSEESDKEDEGGQE